MPTAGSQPVITIKQWAGLHCLQVTEFLIKVIGQETVVEMSRVAGVRESQETALKHNAGASFGVK